jgi:hypothetical protein
VISIAFYFVKSQAMLEYIYTEVLGSDGSERHGEEVDVLYRDEGGKAVCDVKASSLSREKR